MNKLEVGMSAYQRVMGVLEDGEWHTISELKEVCYFPDRWIEELRKEGLEVIEDEREEKVVLVPALT